MAAAVAHDSPKYKSSLICCTQTEIVSSTSSSTSGCVSSDESFDITSYMPKSFVNKKLMIHSTATKEQIEKTITVCKELIFKSEQCSDERKWLVRYLVELRLRLEDLKDNEGAEQRLGVVIKSHHFQQQTTASNRKQYCDHCSGIIWNIVQASYICSDCGYVCHYKCVDHVCRVCAHVIMADKGQFEMKICPERGLAAQNYKCAECQIAISFQNAWNEPRLCDYTGLYFCTTCHWNDSTAIPARVVHNWDWDKKCVSRLAYQMLRISWTRPYINIEKENPKLFSFIAELEWVHKMRTNLEWIRKYLCACPDASNLMTSPLFKELGDVNKKYSMAHLEAINDNSLETQLTELTEVSRTHITNCSLCSGKGYLCEICSNDEIIYPFDCGAIMCDKCNSLYHRGCWLRKNQTCIKCRRLADRKKKDDNSEDETDIYVQYDIDRFVNPSIVPDCVH